jgi:coenzyme F420-0:L-glutamate ligase / coenzyme F420-1:gamma-L-glutamate ligase
MNGPDRVRPAPVRPEPVRREPVRREPVRRGPVRLATPATLTVTAVPGIPAVRTGDDLAALVVRAADAAGLPLRDGDVVVVSSKVVSKAEGRSVPAPDAPARDAAVDAETVRLVAERDTPRGRTRIVQSRSAPVLAAAGVDGSNVDAGTALLLPADPDGSARALRARLTTLSGRRVGVLVTDTAGRPWRDGQTDLAVGAAGVRVVDDLRGTPDGSGALLEVTVRALADELAALADLVKGKADALPVAVVRGSVPLVTVEDGPGAAALLRPAASDWFRLGHVEAVRAALGAGALAPPSVLPASRADRMRRAVAVALAAEADPARWRVEPGEQAVVLAAGVAAGAGDPATLVALGALAQRVVSALWAEDLEAAVETTGGPAGPQVRVAVRTG